MKHTSDTIGLDLGRNLVWFVAGALTVACVNIAPSSPHYSKGIMNVQSWCNMDKNNDIAETCMEIKYTPEDGIRIIINDDLVKAPVTVEHKASIPAPDNQ